MFGSLPTPEELKGNKFGSSASFVFCRACLLNFQTLRLVLELSELGVQRDHQSQARSCFDWTVCWIFSAVADPTYGCASQQGFPPFDKCQDGRVLKTRGAAMILRTALLLVLTLRHSARVA